MDTTERMMIMGMCLQGILANPKLVGPAMVGSALHHELIAANIKLAHRYADALDPPPELTAAASIARLTKLAYAAIRAAGADGAGAWPPITRVNTERDQDNLDGVFERVSRWFHDPVGFPETISDQIIAAIVAADQAQEG